MTTGKKVSKLRRRKRDNIWEFDYSIRPGEWKEKSTGTRIRKEANSFLAKFRRQLEDDCLPNDMSRWTLSEAINYFLELRRPPNRALRTWKAEKSRLGSVLKLMGDKKLESIDLADFELYQVGRRRQGIVEWCINKELYLLRSILDRANMWNGQLARLYKPLKTKVSDIGKALTHEQLAKLVKTALQNEEWRVTMYGSVLAANTGLRGEEVRQLRLGSIDLDGRVLQVVRATAKNDSAARRIPLNKDALTAAFALYQRALRLGGKEPEHYLLPACLSRHTKTFDPLNGRRGFDPDLHQQSWRSSWESLTEAAGFAGFNFHSLRHTFITHMVEEGVPLEHIQTMVGHLSAAMVRHYSHIATQVLHKDVAVLDSKPVLAHLTEAELLGLPEMAPATVN